MRNCSSLPHRWSRCRRTSLHRRWRSTEHSPPAVHSRPRWRHPPAVVHAAVASLWPGVVFSPQTRGGHMSKHCLHTFCIKIIIIPRLPDLREFVYVHLQAAVAAAPYISALSQGPWPLVLGTTTPTVATVCPSRCPRRASRNRGRFFWVVDWCPASQGHSRNSANMKVV